MASRFYLQVYGCQMNSYEADVVRAIMVDAGYSEVRSESDADALLVLTCSVRAHAEARAIGRLSTFRAMRRRTGAIVGVLGCMAQNLGGRLSKEEGADVVVGPDDYRRLPRMIQQARSLGRAQVATELGAECYDSIHPDRRGGVTALVTIMRGCDNCCSYCVVPSVRGPQRSRSLGSIIEEIRQLADSGTRQVTLLGQNVLAYDWNGHRFADVLRAAHEVREIARIRFLTSHPRDLDDSVLGTIARLPRVCPGLHLPLQSGSDRILALMNRGYTAGEYLDRIDAVRRSLPAAGLTTDVIVGFPTETEDDFLRTLDMIRRVRFDQAYMFRFSPRPGTLAADMRPGVPADEAGRRLTRLIELQNRISGERAAELVGSTHELLVEGMMPDGRGPLGRTPANRVVAVAGRADPGSVILARVIRVNGRTPVALPVLPEPLQATTHQKDATNES